MSVWDQTVQANDISALILDTAVSLRPNYFVTLDLRYGIADALWEAGYRKVEE